MEGSMHKAHGHALYLVCMSSKYLDHHDITAGCCVPQSIDDPGAAGGQCVYQVCAYRAKSHSVDA